MWYFVVASNIRVHPFNYLGKIFSEFSLSFQVIFNQILFRVRKSSYFQCFNYILLVRVAMYFRSYLMEKCKYIHFWRAQTFVKPKTNVSI